MRNGQTYKQTGYKVDLVPLDVDLWTFILLFTRHHAAATRHRPLHQACKHAEINAVVFKVVHDCHLGIGVRLNKNIMQY